MKKRWISLFLILSLVLCGCAEQPSAPVSTETAAVPAEPELLIHYIDVGQADSILIEYEDYHLLIDGGNKDDGQLVVSYLEQQGVESLDAVVCTHAHEDHVGGLPSVLAVYPVEAVYAPTRTYSSKIFDDFLYYVDQQRQEVIIPEPGTELGTGELEITVLGPVMSYADPNDTSIVLRLEYGETSFLFTGDMETTAENDMLDYWGDRVQWQTDVLKVGHHGSNTSTGHRFLYAVNPTYGVISVGTDNSYGHPHEEPMSRLKDAGVTALRTDELGHILAASDGKEVTFTWGNQSAQPEQVEKSGFDLQIYIGNKNSKTYHTEDCGSLPKEENRVYFFGELDAQLNGYEPHSGCIR